MFTVKGSQALKYTVSLSADGSWKQCRNGSSRLMNVSILLINWMELDVDMSFSIFVKLTEDNV